MSRAIEVVGRVRKAREQDSLVGLAHATTAWEQRAEVSQQAATAYDRLDQAVDAAAGAFVAHRALLAVRAAGVDSLEAAEQDSAVTAALAREHWQADRTRRRTIELLQERQARQRAQERARAEQRELDALAEQRHQRLLRERRGNVR